MMLQLALQRDFVTSESYLADLTCICLTTCFATAEQAGACKAVQPDAAGL